VGDWLGGEYALGSGRIESGRPVRFRDESCAHFRVATASGADSVELTLGSVGTDANLSGLRQAHANGEPGIEIDTELIRGSRRAGGPDTFAARAAEGEGGGYSTDVLAGLDGAPAGKGVIQ